ncbi:MAG: hypothetical protein EVA19_00285 [Acidimicrobiales bacterium]|nr:MAG: hypothetical protein EVA19_00285 [Acidimicrobiales bacterium]
MTWCDKCDRDFDIGLLSVDGHCPGCATWLADPPRAGSVPWHFWVVVAGAVIYLGWRAAQGILWAVQQLF